MVKEKFDCTNCGKHGTVAYKESDSRFEDSIVFCPFCGADLELQLDEDILLEDEYEE